MALDTGRPGVVETEAARLRARLLEVYWDASALPPRDRRARLDETMQESVAHLEAATRDRVVERVLDELARFSPPEEAAQPAGGGDLAKALRASLVGEGADAARLSPEDEALLEAVRVMVEHLQTVSKNHVEFLKKIIRTHTSIAPPTLRDEVRSALKRSPGNPAALWEPLKELLHRLELTRNLFHSCARVAAQQGLRKLIDDLNPARGGEAGRVIGKKGWEEFERIYEMIEALPPDALSDKYFNELYKKEINERMGG